MTSYDVDAACERWEEARKAGDNRRAAAIARQIRAHGFRHPWDILYSRRFGGMAAQRA